MTEDEIVTYHDPFSGPDSEQLREIVEDRGVWHLTVHGITKSWTQFSN